MIFRYIFRGIIGLSGLKKQTVYIGVRIRGPLGIKTLSIRSLVREPQEGLRRVPFLRGLPKTLSPKP